MDQARRVSVIFTVFFVAFYAWAATLSGVEALEYVAKHAQASASRRLAAAHRLQYGGSSGSNCDYDAHMCSRAPYISVGATHCCSKQCVNIFNHISNCGRCGNKCEWGTTCCNGKCINTNENPQNCGECGYSCPRNKKCAYGFCSYAY
ncbi:hypothetical protein O6H91_14G078600 [Diphasiastrum complanatum]|uniref:Uncharacterized protein n=1 Tax=Diphasiastrum complanatum TaxID=34168 RepID=A0ACC2BS30_DIPCM|nr:hypothetical protein O6H91_14G078600 [Diphasiastrum complanatum]